MPLVAKLMVAASPLTRAPFPRGSFVVNTLPSPHPLAVTALRERWLAPAADGDSASPQP